MSRRPIPTADKRVFVGCRISPKSMKFLKTIRSDNIGRAIDQLVIAHSAVLTAIRNRLPINQGLTKRQPSELDLPRIQKNYQG